MAAPANRREEEKKVQVQVRPSRASAAPPPSAPPVASVPSPVPVPVSVPVPVTRRGRKSASIQEVRPPPMPTRATRKRRKPASSSSRGAVRKKYRRVSPDKNSQSFYLCEHCQQPVPEADLINHSESHFHELEESFDPNKYLPLNKDELEIVLYNTNTPNEECPICTMLFKEKQQVIYLPCTHVFHRECIFDYIDRKPTSPLCPICQSSIFRTTPS